MTGIAMMAFAGNSLLCRMALGDGAIDPASFTILRLLSGTVTLATLLWVRQAKREALAESGSWRSALTLIFYAVTFSYAYVSLNAATGALILFGCVQGTMIVSALMSGERPSWLQSAGWILAASGLVALLVPGASAPSLTGAALMALSGIGWGLYSLFGRTESRPLAATTGNFIRVLAPAALLIPIAALQFEASASGVLLAVLAGSLTTGIGYIIWYAALPSLTSLQAALVQLSVPAIAAFGGILLLDEEVTLRLVLCGALILGGIGLSVGERIYSRRQT